MPVAQLVNLIWRYKSGLVYRGAALMFTGLPIVFADRATGVVTAPADDPELGWLALTVMGLALILP